MRKQNENGSRLLPLRGKDGETKANEKHHDISFLNNEKRKRNERSVGAKDISRKNVYGL
ncbi:MAG: hypothetical protein SOW45_08385 [Prevotella sp.]|nr:hypothetical protein [Prevotellaceae bacterium]MDY3104701.1 hypothetical protein [Prevotella sp.]MDY5844118.1 hypothetical protein [Prevotella sp.]